MKKLYQGKRRKTRLFGITISLLSLVIVVVGVLLAVLANTRNQDLRGDAAIDRQLNFSQTFAANWYHIDRPGVYDYAASGFEDGDRWRVYTCGGKMGQSQDANGNWVESAISGDWIFYTEIGLEGSLGTTEVLSPSQNKASMDSRFVCAPAVVELDNKDIQAVVGGNRLFMMHYECSPDFGENIHGFTEICVAYSSDGRNWQKYNQDLWNSQYRFDASPTAVATPVLRAKWAPDRCGYEFDGVSHKMRKTCPEYGVGHPTTLIIDTNGPSTPGGEQIWMWYYDSAYRGKRLLLTKSWDGFNFEEPVPTDITRPADVKYFSAPGLSQKYFVATVAYFGKNYYAWSTDGINWTKPNHLEPTEEFRLGSGTAVESECTAPAQPTILGNSKGIVTNTYVNILSGEGFYGQYDNTRPGEKCYSELEDKARGSTWGVRVIQGSFSDR